MSLRLYLDDCAYSRLLRTLLENAKHDVQVPVDVEPSLTGASDQVHLAHAIKHERIIMTYNARDFVELHEAFPEHPGIFVIYQSNDAQRDMTYRDIVRAVDNLLSTNVQLEDRVWALNAYQW